MPGIHTTAITSFDTRRVGRALKRGGRLRCLAPLAAALLGLAAAPAMAANQTVQVADTAFTQPGVAITPGDTVTWNYAGGGDEHHNVRFEDGQLTFPSSGAVVLTPWTTMRTFPVAGVYRYYCEHHGGPNGQGMSGIVYVNAGATLPGSPPVASFTVSSALVTVGQNVTLNAAASSDPDGALARYEWDVDGNGTFETDGGLQPVVTTQYPTAGARTIRLRVTDPDGRTAQTTRPVTVTSVPIASFTVAPASAQTGQSVGFDASASSDPDGTIARYEWDLDGNGSYETDTGTTATTARAYATAQSLTIGLRVTDNLGVTGVTSRGLQVSAPPPPPPPPPPAAVTPPAAVPPPSGPGESPADRSRPVVSAFSLRPSSLRAKSSGGSVTRSGGVLVRYRLSEAATATFSVQRVEKGRRKGRSCQKPSRSNRSGASCTRYVTIRGSFRHSGVSAKLNSVRFSGRIGGRKLRPARYRMRVVARDAAGNRSAVRSANFRIKR